MQTCNPSTGPGTSLPYLISSSHESPFSEEKKVDGVKEQHPELFSGLPRYEHTQHKYRHREGEGEGRGGGRGRVSRDMSLPSTTKKSSVPTPS